MNHEVKHIFDFYYFLRRTVDKKNMYKTERPYLMLLICVSESRKQQKGVKVNLNSFPWLRGNHEKALSLHRLMFSDFIVRTLPQHAYAISCTCTEIFSDMAKMIYLTSKTDTFLVSLIHFTCMLQILLKFPSVLQQEDRKLYYQNIRH